MDYRIRPSALDFGSRSNPIGSAGQFKALRCGVVGVKSVVFRDFLRSEFIPFTPGRSNPSRLQPSVFSCEKAVIGRVNSVASAAAFRRRGMGHPAWLKAITVGKGTCIHLFSAQRHNCQQFHRTGPARNPQAIHHHARHSRS